MTVASSEREATKKCATCNRTKGLHLFYKNSKAADGYDVSCKFCKKKKAQEYRATLKSEDILKSKSRTLRNNWVAKAKKLGIDKSEIPVTNEIYEWLFNQQPLTCYLTQTELGLEFEVDHKTPLARGGSFCLTNCGVTSRTANMAKGPMKDDEFLQLLDLISEWEDMGDNLLGRLQQANNVFGRRK